MGAGCAFLDYDNDGWLDIYLVNSGASDFFTPKTPLKNALYRNNRDGTFTDVTDKAGVAAGGNYGMGVAAGDFDADGFADIYVTSYGRNILYRNNGNGTFNDVTDKAGVAAPAGLRARLGSTTTATGGSTSSSRASSTTTRRRISTARTSRNAASTAARASSSRSPRACFATTATAPLRT